MSNTVRVSKIDDVFMKVYCDDGLARDLYDFFSYTVPNAKFMPSFKNRYWDGKVRLFSLKTHKIYIGLLPYVDEFCSERGFEFEGVSDILGTKQREKCSQSWLADLNLPFEPREYQLDAFNTVIQYGRQLLLSPTPAHRRVSRQSVNRPRFPLSHALSLISSMFILVHIDFIYHFSLTVNS